MDKSWKKTSVVPILGIPSHGNVHCGAKKSKYDKHLETKGIRQYSWKKIMYIPNEDTKKYPICRLHLVWTLN